MREINLTFANFGNRVIPIGTAGENLAMQVKIDCSAPLAEHPGAHAALTVNPPSGGEYTGETWTDGTDVYWKVQNSDLLVPGRGNVVLSIIDNLGMILETAAAIIVIQDNNESGALPKWLDDLIAKALYLDSIAEPAAAGAVAAKLLAEAAATNAAASAADAAQYTAAAVATWLDAHPEATTTVQDGAITRAKLDADLQGKTDAVDDLKSAVDAVVESTDVWSDPISQSDFTRLSNKAFYNYTIQDKNGYSILYCQAPETGTYRILFSVTNAQNSARVYSGTDLLTSQYVSSATSVSNSEKYVTAEAGQYIVAQAWYLDYTLDAQMQSGIEYDIPQIDEKITAEENNIFPTGWGHFPVGNFSRNEWTGYNSTSSRNYRVKYNDVVQFNRDTYLKAKIGFYLETYTTLNVYSGVKTSFICLANTPYKINIRRKTENSSETADIEEFANALEYSTPFAGIESNKLTFTDISMFERIGIGGDSYASGGGFISGIRSLTWGKNLERQSGITVDIYAQSGQAIHTSNGWNYNENNGLPALLAGEECGLYWLAHGINSGASSCGTPEDMEANPKPYTFYGQYAYAIEAIQAKFPRARIVISTVEGTNMALYQSENAAVNTAIKNIAEHFSIPLIDLADDDFYWSKFYEDNGLSNHPTAMLCAGMAMANRRLLSSAILSNPSYFIDFGNKYKTAISCSMVDGGEIKATPSIAANGATVTLSNTPLPGYHFVRYESSDVTITDGSFVVPGTSGGVGHGTYTITGVFEADA